MDTTVQNQSPYGSVDGLEGENLSTEHNSNESTDISRNPSDGDIETSRLLSSASHNNLGDDETTTSTLGFSDNDKTVGIDNLRRHRSLVIKHDFQHGSTSTEDCKNFLTMLVTIVSICSMGVLYLVAPTHESNSRFVNQGFTDDDMGSSFRPDFSRTLDAMPFEAVNRGDYSADASTIIFPELFHPSLRNMDESNGDASDLANHKKKKRPLLKFPLPTGAFWTNLVIRPTADRGLSYPIMVYPYGYKWSPTMMQFSYPPLRRMKDDISIRDIFNPDMQISTVETITRRNIIAFDPLSVTLRFYGSDTFDRNETYPEETSIDDEEEGSYWESYLVQGSPYITSTFSDITPILTPLSTFQNFVCPRDASGNYKDSAKEPVGNGGDGNGYGVCNTMNSDDPYTVTNRGVQFLIQTQENLTWMLFASEPITLTYDARTKRTITSDTKYSGTLRLALIPPPLDTKTRNTQSSHYQSISLSESSGVKRLINHSHTYPVGSKISWDFQTAKTPATTYLLTKQQNVVNTLRDEGSENTIGSVNFEFVTKSMHGTSSTGDLLMLALPHHQEILPTKSLLDSFDVTYHSIKGAMKAVIGDTWSYDECLTNVGFDDAATYKKVADMDNVTRSTILNQVKEDLTRVLPTLNENVYGFGKQVARLAQLAHISSTLQSEGSHADKSKESDHDTALEGVGSRAITQLRWYLRSFLDGVNSDSLVYDTNFGGIITRNGLLNSQEDFGNGWYNDHHFHYGYILYACAIMGKIDPTFVEEFGQKVDTILFDVAHNPEHETDLQFFPLARHKSWFDSHSFASGLFPFADGKSQESSSEAINCYYGAMLWSTVRYSDDSDGEKQVNFAKLLLAMEIRGAKTYWHMKPPSDSDTSLVPSEPIYDPAIEKTYMAGNVGMTDVTISTWFGTESLYVHMINFMPITAITREVFDQSYIEEEFTNIIKPIYDNVQMAWRGYTICDRAMLEPSEAWNDATKLRSYELDSALSQSQVYYWISTMEGFKPPSSPSESQDNTENPMVEPNDSSKNQSSKTSAASCVDNKACNDLGLTGLCCPTNKGIQLGCCN